MKRVVLVVGLTCLGAHVLPQQQLPIGKRSWLQKQFFDRIEFSGQRTLGYQINSFTGDAEAFNTLTNFGTGLQRFTDLGSLSIRGNKVLGFIDFSAQFTDNRFQDPEQQQYLLNYTNSMWDLSYGTVQASLRSNNQFINFSRSLEGSSVGYQSGGFSARYLRSEARGQARTITLEGNNTVGPYYLSSGRIIPGTMVIRVDGKDQRLGVDYVLDSQIGSITFNTEVIPPTSSILASFESYDFAAQRGSIEGQAIGYDFGQLGRVGYTSVKQRSGSNSPTGVQREAFQGQQPNATYTLLFVPRTPISDLVTVTVNGIPVKVGLITDGIPDDFEFNPRINAFTTVNGYNPEQTILIEYRTEIVQTVDGNRDVTGFDYSLPLGGPGNFLTYSQSRGEGISNSGTAKGYGLRFGEGKGRFSIGAREIEPGYQSIEQTGFNRNERAVDFNLNYSTKGVESNFTNTNSLITIPTTSGFSNSRVVNTSANFSYSDPTNDRRSMQRKQTLSYVRTRTVANDDTLLNTVAYREDYRRKKFRLGFGVDDITGKGRISTGAGSGAGGGQTEVSDLGIRTYRVSAGYDPGKNFLLTTSLSRSNVRTSKNNSDGFDYSFNASLNDNGPWSGSSIGYGDSNSGALANLGLVNGNGIGVGNSGFGGNGGIGVISTGTLRTRRNILNLNHRVSPTLGLGVVLADTNSEGDSTSNTSIRTTSLTGSWQIDNAHSLNLDFSRNNAKFLSSLANSSSSDSISVYFAGNPGQLWSYSAGLNQFTSDATNFSQSSSSFNADAAYRLGKRQRLFLSAAKSDITGSLAQTDLIFSAGYNYNFGGGLLFQTRYTFRDLNNLDSTTSNGTFRSNGIIFELAFDFSGRR
jgi:hypothetical protein